MNNSQQILFFLSALGAFNSVILSMYFLFFKKNKTESDLFLGGLLLVLSIRIGKSVLYFFDNELSKVYLQVGLSACFLIGPFLYFFVKSKLKNLNHSAAKYSIGLLILIISVFGLSFPYTEYTALWRNTIYYIINVQWFIFILLSVYEAKAIFKKAITNLYQFSYEEVWIVTFVFGVLIIWLTYSFSKYTSYISGALTFSFSFYITFLVLYYAKGKIIISKVIKEKYINKIDEKLVKEIEEKTILLFETEKNYTNPDLTLSLLAQKLNIRPQLLSQVINDRGCLGLTDNNINA